VIDLPAGFRPDRRWLIIATSSRGSAERFAERHGIANVDVLTSEDLLAAGSSLRGRLAATGADVAVIHGRSLRDQRHRALLEIALLLAPGSARGLVDDATGITPVTRAALALRAARLPFEATFGGASAAAAAGRLAATSPQRDPKRSRRTSSRAVLAIWPGEPGVEVGGSVTHIAGMLSGLRQSGYRIGLVLAADLPAQLEGLVDDVERIAQLPPGARVSRDLHALAIDARVLGAARRLAERIPPAFVYQRHQPYLLAGLRLSAERQIPLVLEWNGSEAWTSANWRRRLWIERRLSRLLEAFERRIAESATLVASVSDAATAMAIRAGASPDRIRLVPNGVDLATIDRAIDAAGACRAGRTPRLGWIGSFGPWHGAEVLVRALAELPVDVNAILVGDGRQRPECERLAVELGVSARIDFAGSLPHDQALATLSGCDVLVSPHLPIPDQPFFGSPTKLFEYMALRRPIVASRLGQLGDVLEDGRSACLVEPGDASALAAGISTVLGLPDRGSALADAARHDVEAFHTWDHRAAAVLAGLDLDTGLPSPILDRLGLAAG
jgi:glycosyltransferase involved in cell wall biosynthesis